MTRRHFAFGLSRTRRRHASPHPALDRMRFLFTMSDIERPAASRKARLISTLPSREPRLESETDQNRIKRIGAPPPGGFLTSVLLAVHLRTVVEPDGIEPTTSCLQSTRSPN